MQKLYATILLILTFLGSFFSNHDQSSSKAEVTLRSENEITLVFYQSDIEDEVPEPSIMGEEEMEFIISHAEFYLSANRRNPENDVFVAILGSLRNNSDERHCVRARQIHLILDGEEYDAEGSLMRELKSVITPQRDYVGPSDGHCIAPDSSELTFVAFDVPMEQPETIEFTFDDNIIAISVTFPQDLEDENVFEEILFAEEATNIAALWTPTFTPTATLTLTNSNTPNPTRTFTITPTPTNSSTPRPTNTITNTSRPTRTNTYRPTVPARRTLYITGNGVNVRGCPQINNTTCPAVVVLSSGDSFQGIEIVEGDNFSGSTDWWYGLYDEQEIYVHSSFASTTRPAANPTPPPANNTNNSNSTGNTNPIAPTNSSSPAQGSQWTCSGNIYNCPDFANRCGELYDYFRSCPGDPSDLDGDSDGRPCETQCGG